MLDVHVTDAKATTRYRAASVAPFGAAAIALKGAWLAECNGTRHEGQGDARTIILPAPATAGDRIEVSELAED